MDSLLILVPAFNEEAAIGRVVAEIREAAPGVPVVVVDDCSRDSTASTARAAGAQVLRLPFHLGLGGAVQAGYKLAFELGFEFVIRLDGDGQHDPTYIAKVYEALRTSSCQMVIASRFEDGAVSHSSFLRGLGIRFFRLVLRPILGKPVHDPTSGFVGVNRAALQVFSTSFPLEYPEIEALVVLQRKAFRFVEIPCRMRARLGGRSSITAGKSLYYIFHVLMGVFVNVLKYEGRRQRKRK
ncbi:MAG: glycosyltransferase family 2 protein [Bryobacteraceae bacterium]|jgi:glycosyltransferase involved in cell wall biosynthesis